MINVVIEGTRDTEDVNDSFRKMASSHSQSNAYM